MSGFYARHKNQLDKLFFVAVFALASYFFIKHVFYFVAPFCFAFLFSLAVEPLVRTLNQKAKIGRGAAALLCLVIAVLLIFVGGATLVLKLWREIQNYAANLPLYVNELYAAVDGIKLYLSAYLSHFGVTSVDLDLDLRGFGPEIVSFVTGGVKNSSVRVVSSVPIIFINIILFLISSFFFIKDKEYIAMVVIENSPPALVRHYRALKKGLFSALGGYVKAEFTILCIVAIVNITGLIVVGNPYALLMGLLIAFMDALPFIGSGFILWPWAVINLISGSYAQAVALCALYVVNLLIRQFLEPRLLSANIGIYPLLTLASMYAGLKIFGPLGFFIGPFIVICIKIILRTFEKSRQAGETRQD